MSFFHAVDNNRWFDLWVGVILWLTLTVFVAIIGAAIYFLGWWSVIITAIIVVALALMYATGYVVRRLVGLKWNVNS